MASLFDRSRNLTEHCPNNILPRAARERRSPQGIERRTRLLKRVIQYMNSCLEVPEFFIVLFAPNERQLHVDAERRRVTKALTHGSSTGLRMVTLSESPRRGHLNGSGANRPTIWKIRLQMPSVFRECEYMRAQM
jgi:hypothetical protein